MKVKNQLINFLYGIIYNLNSIKRWRVLRKIRRCLRTSNAELEAKISEILRLYNKLTSIPCKNNNYQNKEYKKANGEIEGSYSNFDFILRENKVLIDNTLYMTFTFTCEDCNDTLCACKDVDNRPIFECPICKNQWEIKPVYKPKEIIPIEVQN